MGLLVPNIAASVTVAVSGTEADISVPMAAGTSLTRPALYEFASSTACWIKQGKAWTITCVTKATLAAGDLMTIADDGAPALSYCFDLTGSATLPTGGIQVNVSADSTAAQVAARLRTAILANQPALAVTDNADGTLTVVREGAQLAMTEAVAAVGFTVTNSTALAATAGTGSMFVPAGVVKTLDGKNGQTLSVIQDAAGGKACLTPVRVAW